MAQTLEAMRRRIETAEDLYGVVRVMKALAAASVRQYETAVESLTEYNRTIEAGLQIVLRNHPEAIPAETRPGQHVGVIIFGSDQGMCGSFNEQVAEFALEKMEGMGEAREDRTVLAVGTRAVGRLEDAGYAINGKFLMPGSIPGIVAAVNEVLLAVEELRFREGIDRFILVHHRPVAPAGSRPRTLQLLPLDPAWLTSLAKRDWVSPSLPTFTMDWRRLLSALIRQHLFVALYRAFAESLASENASRLASMHAAEKNIQNHLGELSLHYHQGRQQAITEELLDIIAGFETLTKEDKRTAG
ncbi:MAG: F0F1 ATP synthase subunit gamma [Sphingomonadaceae bacterium]